MVVKDAWPALLSGALPRFVDPEVKTTAPVGGSPPLTVTWKVAGWPAETCDGPLTDTFAGAWLTVSLTTPEPPVADDAAKSLSPA